MCGLQTLVINHPGLVKRCFVLYRCEKQRNQRTLVTPRSVKNDSQNDASSAKPKRPKRRYDSHLPLQRFTTGKALTARSSGGEEELEGDGSILRHRRSVLLDILRGIALRTAHIMPRRENYTESLQKQLEVSRGWRQRVNSHWMDKGGAVHLIY